MLISGDAIGYHGLGETFQRQDWGAYFLNGPNREPGYPLLVAASLTLGQWTGVDYQVILKAVQLILLGTAQLLVWRWLYLLGASSAGIMLAVGYIGFSPALLNAALSMYSEILIIPILVTLILAHVYWGQALCGQKRWTTVFWSIWIALLWLACIFVKAVFWYVFLMYWPLLMMVLIGKLSPGKRVWALSGWILAAVIVVASVQSYLNIQFSYNGSRMLTDRGNYIFYANTVRRTAVIDHQRALAGVLSVPGEGVCNALMRPEDCWYWGILNQDKIGFAPLMAWSQSRLSGKQRDDRLFAMGFDAIKTNPGQYVLYTFFEAFKMLFWESTQVSYVQYPPWLEGLYAKGIVKNLWRLFPALISLWAFMALVVHMWGLRQAQWDRSFSVIVLLLVIVLLSGMYALATIVTRYAFMFGPLWIGLWVLAAERRRIFFGTEERCIIYAEKDREDLCGPHRSGSL